MRCFIISPIGQPGSPAREHADDVLECVIVPALQATGVDGRRADHVRDVGRITRQMYDDILSADFCIALLHGYNPNVFYELAVAHSAGIPVVILSEKGHDPPFDLKDERVLHYDLGARSIFRGDNVHVLREMIESVRRLEGRREVPFGTNLTPLNAPACDLPFSLTVDTDFNSEFWLRLVKGAQSRLYLAGIGFVGWKAMPGMREALSASAVAGCEIRILTMDSDNAAFRCMMNPQIAGAEAVKPGLADTRAWFRNTVAGGARAEVRALGTGMLSQQIVVADDQALISPYFYSSSTRHSPCLRVVAELPAFGSFLREFNALWDDNAPVAA